MKTLSSENLRKLKLLLERNKIRIHLVL